MVDMRGGRDCFSSTEYGVYMAYWVVRIDATLELR
jgi:hypothetical protein